MAEMEEQNLKTILIALSRNGSPLVYDGLLRILKGRGFFAIIVRQHPELPVSVFALDHLEQPEIDEIKELIRTSTVTE